MAKNIKSNKMINYDPEGDVLYLGVRNGNEEEYKEIAPGIGVELGKDGSVIGIEILNASRIIKSVFKSRKSKTVELTPAQ